MEGRAARAGLSPQGTPHCKPPESEKESLERPEGSQGLGSQRPKEGAHRVVFEQKLSEEQSELAKRRAGEEHPQAGPACISALRPSQGQRAQGT